MINKVLFIYVFTGNNVEYLNFVRFKPVLGKKSPRQNPPGNILLETKKCQLRFSVATLFRFVARFARVKIENSSRNRFALNVIQMDFCGGIFFRGNLSRYHHRHVLKTFGTSDTSDIAQVLLPTICLVISL